MPELIKVCIIGAGSSYTPELIAGILARPVEELPIGVVSLHDVDPGRLGVMAALAGRMAAAQGRDLRLESGLGLEPLLEGADFVITQLRVGGMAARHQDESIPLKYGVIGQETTGPGGMFKALRAIPAMLDIARLVERIAPEAFILNYTNPSGVITEAVSRHTGARIIGLCSGIPTLQVLLAAMLSKNFPNLKSYTVGLNHLGFINRFTSNGAEVTDQVLDRLLEIARASGRSFFLGDPKLIALIRAVPIMYVDLYYYHRRKTLGELQQSAETRAQKIMHIEKEIFAQAADPHLAVKPKALQQRGGLGYSDITFEFIKAIRHDRGRELVCTVLNRGAVDGIEAEAGVEIVCRVGRQGPQALPVGPIPLAYRGLVQAVKTYESLTVQAAVEGRRDLAVLALTNHPLVGDHALAESLVKELSEAHAIQWRKD